MSDYECNKLMKGVEIKKPWWDELPIKGKKKSIGNYGAPSVDPTIVISTGWWDAYEPTKKALLDCEGSIKSWTVNGWEEEELVADGYIQKKVSTVNLAMGDMKKVMVDLGSAISSGGR